MRIVVHHSKFYDWEPVPADVVVTPADISSGKVKSAGRAGGWLMRVAKEPVGGTHTMINVPEEQIIAKIIHEATRPEGGRTLTRKQAAAFYVSENVMPHHAHRSWLTKFEIDDDGADEAMLRKMLALHVEAVNIEASEVEAHVAAYTEPATAKDHADHMHTHFKVKAKPHLKAVQ
jgi:hypothetical protein